MPDTTHTVRSREQRREQVGRDPECDVAGEHARLPAAETSGVFGAPRTHPGDARTRVAADREGSGAAAGLGESGVTPGDATRRAQAQRCVRNFRGCHSFTSRAIRSGAPFLDLRGALGGDPAVGDGLVDALVRRGDEGVDDGLRLDAVRGRDLGDRLVRCGAPCRRVLRSMPIVLATTPPTRGHPADVDAGPVPPRGVGAGFGGDGRRRGVVGRRAEPRTGRGAGEGDTSGREHGGRGGGGDDGTKFHGSIVRSGVRRPVSADARGIERTVRVKGGSRRSAADGRAQRRHHVAHDVEHAVDAGTVQRHAAVDHEVLAGDETGEVGAQEHHDVGDVVGLADAGERRLVDHVLLAAEAAILEQQVRERRRDHPRSDGVDPDGRRVLERRRRGERGDRSLRRRVGRLARRRARARDRRRRHDRAAARLQDRAARRP